MMTWAHWTDEDWLSLVALCREDGIELPEDEIRATAENYMDAGADGGGNKHGVVGTLIALHCDRIARGRRI